MTEPGASGRTKREKAPVIETYEIQEWLFDARDQVEIDLANSAVQYQLAGDVSIDADWGFDYAPDRGLPETRAAVAALYGRGRIPVEHVMLANGAQEALYLFYRCLLAPDDHIVTTTPGWQQSWSVPRHMGCRVAQLPWPPGERLSVAGLEALLERDTRLLILNSPGNPSGCKIRREDWARIVAIAEERETWILSDEEFAVALEESVVHGYDRAISVSGLSKTYGMAGLRVGWAVAGSDTGAKVIERMVNYKRYTTISNSVLSERIAVNAIAQHTDQIARYESLLASGRRLLEEFAASNSTYLSLVPPEGTPFAWFDVRAPISSRITSKQFAQLLLAKAGVRVMPAEVFGYENGLRLTYARPRDVLAEGLQRVAEILDSVGADGRPAGDTTARTGLSPRTRRLESAMKAVTDGSPKPERLLDTHLEADRLGIHPYVIVDAFTDSPLAGNQLGVFTDGRCFTGETMQRLARELKFAESVFLLPPTEGGHARVRIFSPTVELPFAGHPVLGAGLVIAATRGLRSLELETGVGQIPLKVELAAGPRVAGRVTMEQPIPEWCDCEDAEAILAAVGAPESVLPVETYNNGRVRAYVQLTSEQGVASLIPDPQALRKFPDLGVVCFAPTDGAWVARVFSPSQGFGEDAATGSAAGPIAVHLARHGHIRFGERIEIRQGAQMGRPSILYAQADGDGDRIERVEVSGSALIVARGHFCLA